MKELKDFIRQCVVDGTMDKSVVSPLVTHIKRVANRSRHLSADTKQKISESKKGQSSKNKGKRWMCNQQLNKSRLVDPVDVQDFSEFGWVMGRLEFNKGDE